MCVLQVFINSCFRRICLPAAFIYVCILNVFGTVLTVTIVRESGHKAGPGFNGNSRLGKALFPLMAIQGYVAILAVGSVAGTLNKTSKAFLGKLKQAHYEDGRKEKYFMAKWKSCAPMKVRFANNFVEISTPLVMLSYCLKVVVRLLLITD